MVDYELRITEGRCDFYDKKAKRMCQGVDLTEQRSNTVMEKCGFHKNINVELKETKQANNKRKQ